MRKLNSRYIRRRKSPKFEISDDEKKTFAFKKQTKINKNDKTDSVDIIADLA